MANIKMQLTYIFQQLKIVHIQIKMFPENIPAKNYMFTELKKNYFYILENEVDFPCDLNTPKMRP